MIRMNARQSILGIITIILMLIVILGMGIDSINTKKKKLGDETYPAHTMKVLEFEYNYHIQRGALPY